MQRYGEALADALLAGKSTLEAIALARKAHAAPEGTKVLAGGTLGRGFASGDPVVNLLGAARGDRTDGTMKITLPVEEANPHAAWLVLTLNDWDQDAEGEIFLNGHKVQLATSNLSNGRDHAFPPVRLPTDWLRFGDTPNELKFVYLRTAGFIVRRAEIVIGDAP